MGAARAAKLIFIFLLIGLIATAYRLGLLHYLNLENLKSNQAELDDWVNANPLFSALSFLGVYVFTTAMSLPGAAVLTLGFGALFGLVYGTVLASIGSTVGATLAFLSARYLFRSAAERRFAKQLKAINEGLDKQGAFYLLTLRLVPLFPFFMLNLLMGLTSFSAWRFAWVSQLGMLPGTIVFVNAGTELAKIDTLQDIFSPSLVFALTALGLIPLLIKKGIDFFHQSKSSRQFKRPKKFDYNLVVLGAGSGGLVSAYIASSVKAKVALIEKHRMGGDCLNTGCVPSKALIRSAHVAHLLKNADRYGIENAQGEVSFAQVMSRVHRVIRDIEPHDSIKRYEELGVECISGQAFIRSPFEVEVNGRVLTTRSIIIATGARPIVPEIPGLKEVSPLTSDSLWNLTKRPERLLILGGGPIGCELAQAFSRLGSQVTLVEQSERLLSKEDPDVSVAIEKTFKTEGIHVFTSHKAVGVEVENAEKILICEKRKTVSGPASQAKGPEVRIPFDEILVALGRRANTQGFGLEQLGVELSPQRTIAANEYMATTNFSNIFVCGDVAGPYQFTHTASHQAWYAAVNSLFSPFSRFKVDYRVIPWCTFTAPEVARVGLNEEEAKARSIHYEVTTYHISDLDRAIADGEAEGFVKVLTAAGSDRILGVTIVGHHAGETIGEFVTAMKFNLGLNKVLGTIHIYPTHSEANKYTAGAWKRSHAPQLALRLLEAYHRWRR